MIIVALFSPVHAACPDFAEPDGDWLDDAAASAAAAPDAFAALEAYAFPDVMDEEGRTGVRTDGLLIVRDGTILYERYGRDWTADMPHLQWSATKSVAATMVGMAAHRGLLDVDASICDVIEVGNPAACAVTVRNLMEHSSGFAWRETYEGSSPTASSVVGMLYGAGMDDMSFFVTSHELRDAPGTSYRYSSGDTVVQSAVAHTVLAASLGPDYLTEHLFGPLGMHSAQFEVDRLGRPIGSSSLHLTPRDMARYGSFMLQDGCWGGERMLPEGWMARATTPASSIEGKLMKPFSGSLPGWNVWLNTTHPAVLDGQLPWPDAPEGTFAALGHWRQSIYVMPDHGVVIARTGDDRDGTFQHNDFLALVAEVVEALPVSAPAAEAIAEPADDAASVEGTEPDEPAEGMASAEGTATAEPAEGASEPGDGAEPDAPALEDVAVRGFTPAAFPPPALGPVAESVAAPPDKYDVGLLRIGTSFAALHGCACRYIAERAEQACIDYIRIQPDIARASFDDETQTVTARALGFAKTQARPGPDGTGCQLVD